MVIVGGKTLPDDDWCRKYYWDLRKNAWNCSRCSICKWIDAWEVKDARFVKVCPSSHRYLFDAYSCQGRMDIALAMIDEILGDDHTDSILDIMYKCDACGGCDAMCKRVQDMEPLRVMLEMRARLVQSGRLLPEHMVVIDHLRKEDNMVMGQKADRGKWAEGLNVKDLTRESARFAFHAGCKMSFDERLWKTARTTVALLGEAGLDIGIMGSAEACCGGKAYEMGYRGELTKYAENNMEAWKNAGVRTIITACSDGYYTFKRLYPEQGSEFEVVHVVELIDRMIQEGRIRFTKELPMTVTYHDPCHLGRRSNAYVPGRAIMGVYDAPRNIIKSVPGVELTEMYRIKEYAWCCGAGGGVREAFPDFSLWTAGERIAEAGVTGAEAIVTACPWCVSNFRDAIEDRGDSLKVYDIIEILQMAR